MTTPFSNETTTTAQSAPTAPATIPDRSAMQCALNHAVTRGGAPGMVVEVRDDRGRWFGSAGVSDTGTGRERQPSERFRIGSTTKAFTAALVLRLAAEGKLGLDDTMERWLPGLVAGNGHDGRAITIRQLLNHTSGILNYGNDPEFFKRGVGAAWFQHRYDPYAPERLIRIGLATPPAFAPGDAFLYSNTNYFLAALIVEKATGGTFAQALTQWIVQPLKLTGTYLPGAEPTIRGPHPRHYSTLFSSDAQPEVHDATEMNQSFAWAAGGIISTTGDLQRFFGALLRGRLLPAEQQQDMFTTVDTTGPVPWIPSTRYGLGVFAQTLPTGVTVWGNAGATYGSWTYAVGTRDGGHLLASQVNGDWSGLGVFDGIPTTEFGAAAERASSPRTHGAGGDTRHAGR
ncbi:serine hydrolase domain-containing protein [Streptomyces sp. NPDC060334]|uniref:serine hydrolase domain-containing protein n=1 Tax=Streptomyces sp. NPDC060334 TaxID=3347099 RepID=UPI00364BD030